MLKKLDGFRQNMTLNNGFSPVKGVWNNSYSFLSIKIITIDQNNPNLIPMRVFTHLLFLVVAFIGCTPCQAQIVASTYSDSTNQVFTQQYTGYRLHLSDLDVVKRSKEKWTVNLTVANTGREHLALQTDQLNPGDLKIQMDPAITEQLDPSMVEALYFQVIQSGLSLESGGFVLDQQFSLPMQKKTEDTERMSTTESETEFRTNFDDLEINRSTTIDDDYCPDLHIDSLFVLSRSKKEVVLGYRLTNLGKGPAMIYGQTSEGELKTGIRTNISGSTRLTKGAIAVGGTFIETGLKETDGLLPAGQSLMGKIKIDARRMTKFLSAIILELDAYGMVKECDETNNISSIRIEK